jgi:hypothetical protein
MPLISVVETDLYLRDAEKLLSETERDDVIYALAQDPEQGVLIKGTKGLRKTRIGFGGRGKRGGGRVIYWFKTENLPLVLLAVYAKNEMDDLSDERRQYLVKLASHLETELGARS